MKVQVLYDFSGEPGSAELTISVGQTLTVTRQDVGEGWWEGTDEQGKTGLFPAAYVQEVTASNPPPSIPPPPLPDTYANAWNDPASASGDNPNYEVMDYWDDDWDDDSEGGGGPPPLPLKDHPPMLPTKQPSLGDDVSQSSRNDNKATIGKKNLNRFSVFVKSGGESYILGAMKVNIDEDEKIHILESPSGGVIWNPISSPYSVMVASPKKDSKFKGLKSFIAYQLTPTFNNIQVSRRYKHFDWLHERLVEKFNLIAVPPLPDKQISGRYEGQFIEHRKNQLQAFVDCVCRHPVLSTCEVWRHFITCTDERSWKSGKRKAEKDELVRANFFFALKSPEHPINMPIMEQETESCSRFIHSMDSSVKNLLACTLDQTKKHQGPYKREYLKIGSSFCNLAESFNMEEATGTTNSALSGALKYAGETYNDIGKLFEEQPKMDWEPLGDLMHIFKGILTSFPDILNLHKDAMLKRKECERMTQDHKMEFEQYQDCVRRTDVISYALMAEMNHFHEERVSELNKSMKNFLAEQAAFYQKISAKLHDAYLKFEEH